MYVQLMLLIQKQGPPRQTTMINSLLKQHYTQCLTLRTSKSPVFVCEIMHIINYISFTSFQAGAPASFSKTSLLAPQSPMQPALDTILSTAQAMAAETTWTSPGNSNQPTNQPRL